MKCLLSQSASSVKIACGSNAQEEKVIQEVLDFFYHLDGFKQLDRDAEIKDILELSVEDRKKLQEALIVFFKQKNIALNGDFEIPPTLLAVKIYAIIAKILDNASLYGVTKKASIAQGRILKEGFLRDLEHKIQSANTKEVIEYALKICALGNVIDYGAQYTFDLEEEAKKILQANFAYFDIESFLEKIQDARSLVFIGDNAGENEFDEILITVLRRFYPKLEIFYFTRGAEIINDITFKDLKESKSRLFGLCNVVDSGVLSPGFIENLATREAREIYRCADMILAKGMGNFESLENSAKNDTRVYFLLKIKCNVVALHIQKNLGDFIFFAPSLHGK